MATGKSKDKTIEKSKKSLGIEIANCRAGLSQRKLAEAVGLPPSNMKYIEDGINAPSYDVYAKIIKKLNPPPKQRAIMDGLYVSIRKSPPPDVCEVINNNHELYDAIRLIDGQTLSIEQLNKVKELFGTFAEENRKGEIENGR